MKIAKIVANVAATVALLAFNSAMAQSHDHGHHAPAAAAGQELALSEGEVKKVDKDTGRLTIKHGSLENLGMSGMTMVFGVKDVSALDTLKAGDKIKFVAERLDGRLVVTQLVLQK